MSLSLKILECRDEKICPKEAVNSLGSTEGEGKEKKKKFTSDWKGDLLLVFPGDLVF